MQHIEDFLAAAAIAANLVSRDAIKGLVTELSSVRQRQGRVFVLGVGGSAANASHAVNDFRKLCGIEAYAPTDNVSELTARTNDEGWAGVFAAWLGTSRIGNYDAIFVLSVGGGNVDANVSINLVKAIDVAIGVGARVLGIVGRTDGDLAKRAHAVAIVPGDAVELQEWMTPLAESFQSIVLHCVVSHPLLQQTKTKW